MNIMKLLMVFLFAVFSTQVSAYGSSSSKKACKKPKFSQFTPPHLTVVAPQSEFSFLASALTTPGSISVSVKKQPVEISITEKNSGYLVSGKLPESLEGAYARVEIKATGTNRCKGKDGWLLKIEE